MLGGIIMSRLFSTRNRIVFTLILIIAYPFIYTLLYTSTYSPFYENIPEGVALLIFILMNSVIAILVVTLVEDYRNSHKN